MICPVCEHNQVFGVECEVCGKELGGIGDLGPPPVREERVEGLEVTLYAPQGEVAVEKLGELEVTHFAAVQVTAEQTPDVEYTAQAPVGAVSVERLGEMQVDRVPDDGQRTVLPTGPVPCRYCRHVQASGVMCERCGMRLPVVVEEVGLIVGVAEGRIELKTRCKACGAPALGGQRCGDCGAEVPFPDA